VFAAFPRARSSARSCIISDAAPSRLRHIGQAVPARRAIRDRRRARAWSGDLRGTATSDFDIGRLDTGRLDIGRIDIGRLDTGRPVEMRDSDSDRPLMRLAPRALARYPTEAHQSRAPASTGSGPPRVAVTTRPSGAPSRLSLTARQRGKVTLPDGGVPPREGRYNP